MDLVFEIAGPGGGKPPLGVWVCDLDDPRYESLRAGAPGEPPASADRRQARRQVRRRDLVRGALTLQTLSGYLGLDPQHLVICYDAHGRPALDLDKMPVVRPPFPVDFSISHRENVSAMAVSSIGRIGVDVEIPDPGIDVEAVGRTCLTPAEQQHLNSLAPPARLRAFLECWTAKEAFAKALGLGFTFGVDRVESAPGDDGVRRIVRIDGSEQFVRGWRLAHRRITVGPTEAVLAVVWCGRAPGEAETRPNGG